MKNKATLTIIQGFIGAGKSTFSKKLSLETGAVHLNPDERISKTFDRTFYMNNWDECFHFVTKQLWNETKIYLNNGKDVIFDMGFWKKIDRDYARKIAQDCHADLKLYYLSVPDDILKERILADRPPEWAKIHLQNFDKNKALFEEPSDDENAIVIKNY